MKQLIKQILREELTSTQEKLSRLTKSLGVEGAAEFVGGIDRYINIMYGGDFEKFVKDNDVEVVKFGSDGMTMYFNPIMVELMGLRNGHWMDEKILGNFSYGSPNGIRYSFTANLHPIKQNGEIINIGPDEEEITINSLGRKISQILNVDFDPLYMPGRPNEVFHATCSANKARRLLNYQTSTELHAGLVELVEWIKSQPRKDFSYHLSLEIVNEKTPKTWSERLI